MEINIFWGELTDNSAKKEALAVIPLCNGARVDAPRRALELTPRHSCPLGLYIPQLAVTRCCAPPSARPGSNY